MIDIKDIIKLSDKKEYTVMAKTELDDDIYYYLLDTKDYTNYKFCKLEDEQSLIEITDSETLKKLVHLFAKDLRRELNTGE
jgi:hypothetical protein